MPFVTSAQVGFRHHKDYQAYIWAKGEHTTQVCQTLKFTHLFCATAEFSWIYFSLHQVTFTEEDLPRDDCEYILGYYSNNMNSIVGLSTPIQVKRTKGSHLTASYDAWICKYTHKQKYVGKHYIHIWLLNMSVFKYFPTFYGINDS